MVAFATPLPDTHSVHTCIHKQVYMHTSAFTHMRTHVHTSIQRQVTINELNVGTKHGTHYTVVEHGERRITSISWDAIGYRLVTGCFDGKLRHGRMHARMHGRTDARTHGCTCARTRPRTHARTCACAPSCACAHIHTCIMAIQRPQETQKIGMLAPAKKLACWHTPQKMEY